MRTRAAELRKRVSADKEIDLKEPKKVKVTADDTEASEVIEDIVEEYYLQKPYMKLLEEDDAAEKSEQAWMKLQQKLP